MRSEAQRANIFLAAFCVPVAVSADRTDAAHMTHSEMRLMIDLVIAHLAAHGG